MLFNVSQIYLNLLSDLLLFTKIKRLSLKKKVKIFPLNFAPHVIQKLLGLFLGDFLSKMYER